MNCKTNAPLENTLPRANWIRTCIRVRLQIFIITLWKDSGRRESVRVRKVTKRAVEIDGEVLSYKFRLLTYAK